MGWLIYKLRRTTLLLWFCIAVMAGLGVGYFQLALTPLQFWFSIGGVMWLVGRQRFIGLIGLLIIGLTLGSSRGALIASDVQAYDDLYDNKVTLQVRANEDGVYGTNGQMSFTGIDIFNAETGGRLPGKVGIKGFGPNAVYQHDTILVQGKLRSGIGSYQGFISFGQLELVRHQPSVIADIRRRFAAAMESVLPEPTASFGMGILVGQRANLPDTVKDDLTHVGLTHIIAVSGANLTIMLEASRKLLGKRSKRLSTLLTLALMAGFVLIAGNSPSIIRAAVVSSFSIAAAYYGRRTKPLLIIAMAAALTAYINPILIWSDASWYLSFLAFFGVLIVSPIFHSRLPSVFERSVLLAVAVESICAEIMSLPYVLFTFHQMSYVGLIANMVVVTFIPLSMLVCFIAGLAGLLLWPIAGWFAWPAKFLLEYMLDVAHLVAAIPDSFRDQLALSLPGLVVLYVLIATMCLLLSFKNKPKNATITDETDFKPYEVLGRMS